jgi:hypothetical protein
MVYQLNAQGDRSGGVGLGADVDRVRYGKPQSATTSLPERLEGREFDRSLRKVHVMRPRLKTHLVFVAAAPLALFMIATGTGIPAGAGASRSVRAPGTITCSAAASAQISPIQQKSTALTPSTATITVTLTHCHATAFAHQTITGKATVTEQSTDGICGGPVGKVSGRGTIKWSDRTQSLAPTVITILNQSDTSTPALGFHETIAAKGSFAGPSFTDTYLIASSEVHGIITACAGKGPGFTHITLTNANGTKV